MSFKSGQNGAGIVLGLASAGWYFGGIAGGAGSAARGNRHAEDFVLKPLEVD